MLAGWAADGATPLPWWRRVMRGQPKTVSLCWAGWVHMGKSFCPRKLASRFESFGLKQRCFDWLNVEVLVSSVSGYLVMLMVERVLALWLPCQLCAWCWGEGASKGTNVSRFVPVKKCKFVQGFLTKSVLVLWMRLCTSMPSNFPPTIAGGFKKNVIYEFI